MDCVSSRPASAANIHIFTRAAFAFVAFKVPELFEELRILPDILE
jgi:hypothetical protein